MQKLLITVAACLALSMLQVSADSPPSAPATSGPSTVPTTLPALSPFGIGSCYINNRSVQDNRQWMPQVAAIGVHSFRTPHTDWGAVEPEEGKFNWTGLDAQLAYLAEQKMEYGATLIGTPKWNKLDKPGTLPVNNIAGWSNYATQLAKHLKGKVHYYEVWNEPPNFTGKTQTPADYAKLVVASYDAVKAVDPNAKIALAAKSNHVNYLEQVIKAGAKGHFDLITLHPYEVLDGIADNTGSESVFMHIVPTVRKMLAAQDPANVNVPIVFTELGCDAKSKGRETQAHVLVKAYTMAIAQGVSCVQWFEGRDGDSGPMGLIDAKGNSRPAYTALATMIEHLGQHPTPIGWIVSDQSHAFAFQAESGSVVIAWARKGHRHQMEFDQELQVVDPITGKVIKGRSCELTDAPLLILNVPGKLLQAAAENRQKPFPWSGDYTAVKSVSITFGKNMAESGLHTRSGADVAAAVLGYGGSARAGNVPGGNVFIVDPNFLSYTAAPIEITAVVRRNPNNDNAGFKLVYESTKGFKTAGTWYTIPDNKDWHTVTWKIDDPQFVNYWGYNFALESDGNQFNKYFIQSVTVKKLSP